MACEEEKKDYDAAEEAWNRAEAAALLAFEAALEWEESAQIALDLAQKAETDAAALAFEKFEEWCDCKEGKTAQADPEEDEEDFETQLDNVETAIDEAETVIEESAADGDEAEDAVADAEDAEDADSDEDSQAIA